MVHLTPASACASTAVIIAFPPYLGNVHVFYTLVIRLAR